MLVLLVAQFPDWHALFLFSCLPPCLSPRLPACEDARARAKEERQRLAFYAALAIGPRGAQSSGRSVHSRPMLVFDPRRQRQAASPAVRGASALPLPWQPAGHPSGCPGHSNIETYVFQDSLTFYMF